MMLRARSLYPLCTAALSLSQHACLKAFGTALAHSRHLQMPAACRCNKECLDQSSHRQERYERCS